VAIRASSARQIDTLLADLSSSSAVARETAIARLILLGPRAVARLIAIAVASDQPVAARSAAWRALEAVGDSRALEPALRTLAMPTLDAAVGAAAAGIARLHLRGERGAMVVDRLAEVLLDRTRHETVRLAALHALRDLESSTIAPILASLADDPNATVRTEASVAPAYSPAHAANPADVIAQAAAGTLPEDAAILRHALQRLDDSVSPATLHKVLARVREREGFEPAERRDEWRLARAAAHVWLAQRGSRVALYDLRESLESAKGTLPVEFLAAVTLIGDASCVEAIAAAHAKAKDAWWREHLGQAFQAIVTREKLTRRHAAVKRIEKRSPETLRQIWPQASKKSAGVPI
jgi:HEAT repeat protein